MLNDDNFVEEYISNCIDNGVKDKNSICNLALKEMQEINIKIKEINYLRNKYKSLKDVLRKFNHESVRRTKNDHILPEFSDFSNINESAYLPMIIEICKIIDTSDEILTSREIMNRVGNIENDAECYLCIKALSDNGIISKNQERHLIKGPKWDNRPKNN